MSDFKLNLSSGPHTRDGWTTPFIMHTVTLSLLPAAVIGVLVHGINALFVILASILTAVLTEAVFDLICKKPKTWLDGSAVVTGMLLALSLPANVPLYVPILGAAFAILVAKCFFGGLGKNFINPALAGRCFLLISFSKTVATFTVDGQSAATPLADLAAGKVVNVSQMFYGNTNGVIGSSVLALIVGGLILWSLDIIHGEICFSVLISFTLFMALFGGQGFDPGFLLAHLCGGGVVMGAFYMATDYATSPVSRTGQLVYGALIGVLGGLFRCFGSAADSFSYSIIIANLFTPLIDMFIIPKPYAYRKSALRAQSAEKKKSLKERIPIPVIVLAVITLIAGLALSGVYTITEDTIEEQRRAANMESYKEVCENAEIFETSDAADQAIAELAGGVYGTTFGRTKINEAVIAKDAAGNVVGYVVSVTNSEGYDGDITISLGINADGSVNSIAFTELHETPGMGMQCGDDAFKNQFNGRTVDEFVLLKAGGGTAPEEIDSVSGCSTTSGAVVKAVNAGLDFYRNVMKGGN